MTLISLLITLIIVGVILWAVNTLIPMPASIKQMINVVVIIVIAIWLLQVLGLIGGLTDIRIR